MKYTLKNISIQKRIIISNLYDNLFQMFNNIEGKFRKFEIVYILRKRAEIKAYFSRLQIKLKKGVQ